MGRSEMPNLVQIRRDPQDPANLAAALRAHAERSWPKADIEILGPDDLEVPIFVGEWGEELRDCPNAIAELEDAVGRYYPDEELWDTSPEAFDAEAFVAARVQRKGE